MLAPLLVSLVYSSMLAAMPSSSIPCAYEPALCVNDDSLLLICATSAWFTCLLSSCMHCYTSTHTGDVRAYSIEQYRTL